MARSIKEEDHGSSQLGQKATSHLQITRAKWYGIVTQVQECLPSKFKAMRSNSSTISKKCIELNFDQGTRKPFIASKSHFKGA
jgi:hypothetical protein